jgi:hypothetical protein
MTNLAWWAMPSAPSSCTTRCCRFANESLAQNIPQRGHQRQPGMLVRSAATSLPPGTSLPISSRFACGSSATGNYRTLLVRENLAEWTSRSGDAAGARARYTELLAIQERALGADHPSTLKARELTGLLDRRCGIGQDALAIGSARRSDYAAGDSRLAWNAPLLLVGSRY